MALIFIASVLSLSAQVVVEVSLDTASILVGEQVRVTLRCTAGSKQQIQMPRFAESQQITRGVEVVENGIVDTLLTNEGKRMQLTRRYLITSFDSALYTLPPFEVIVDGKKYFSRGHIGLKVNTIAVDTIHVDKFNGPHDVVSTPFEWSWRITLLALLSLLSAIACAVLWIRLTDPKLITRRIVVHPPVPPHVTAITEINKIKQSALTDSKAYYMNLTEVLRSYIDKRFGFSAHEMTSAEIIEKLRSSGDEISLNELRQVLQTADLVKFAKYDTSATIQDADLLQALNFVQTTKVEPVVQPKPHVEYVEYSGRKQDQLRLGLTIGAILLSLTVVLLSIYVIWELWSCFG